MTAGCTLSPVAKQTAGGYLLRGMKRGKELSFASADGLVNSGVMNMMNKHWECFVKNGEKYGHVPCSNGQCSTLISLHHD